MLKIDNLGNFFQILKGIAHFMTSISVASVFQSVAIFAFIFTMSHFGNEVEYAEYRKIFYVIDFNTAIAMFGLGTLILRKPLNSLYENIIPTVLIINAIQLISAMAFAVIQHLPVIRIIEIISFVALNTLYHLSISVIVIKNERKLYFSCTMSCFTTTIIGLIFLTKYNMLSYNNVFFLRIVLLLIYIIPFLSYVDKRLLKIKIPSLYRVVPLFKEAAPIGLGVLLGSCTQYIDKFIASMMDSHQLAVYANASADIPFVGTAISTMSIFFVPIIHSSYMHGDRKGACKNLSELFLYGWYIGGSIFTLLFCNAEFIVDLLYSSRYIESVVLFRIFCLTYLFRIVTYTQVIVALELENIIIKRMFIELILQLVLSFMLLRVFGTIGLSMSVIMVLAFWSVPYNVLNFRKCLHCRIIDILPIMPMLKFILKAFLPCLIVVEIMNSLSINRVIVFAVSITLYCVVNFREVIYIIRKTR